MIRPMDPSPWRARSLDTLARGAFDLLVVGGGITGVAIAREAAIRGWRVALVERGDLASGTSGRSSRLIHGGLRYLKQGRFAFVRKSIRAQAELATAAPRLVRPLDFLVPLYHDGPYPIQPLRAFMGVFRGLHAGLGWLAYQDLTAAACLNREPLLRDLGLTCGYVYREFLTHDARLVVETAMAAREMGAVVLTRAPAEAFLVEGGRVVGARVRDAMTGGTYDVRARAVVNASGPWAGALLDGAAPRLRLSKGVHLAVSWARAPLSHALVLFSPRDTRAVFAIPMGRWVFLGTTETEHRGPPDDAVVEPADVEYLLETFEHAVHLGLGPGDVGASWAAVRPLLDGWSRDPGRLSRDYALVRGDDGLVTVLGGKLSLHRETAARVLATLGAPARTAPDPALPGEVWPGPRAELEDSLALLVGEVSAAHLVATYGGRAAAIRERLERDAALRAPLAPGLPHVQVELEHAAEAEMALFTDDYALRRTDFAIEARVLGLDPGTALAATGLFSTAAAR